MNKVRREELQKIYDLISEAHDRLEVVLDDEDSAKENMPESLQGSERYEKSEDACDAMDDAIRSLEEAMEKVEEAQD